MAYQIKIYDENERCPRCKDKLLDAQLIGDFVIRTCKECLFKDVQLPRTAYDRPGETIYLGRSRHLNQRGSQETR